MENILQKGQRRRGMKRNSVEIVGKIVSCPVAIRLKDHLSTSAEVEVEVKNAWTDKTCNVMIIARDENAKKLIELTEEDTVHVTGILTEVQKDDLHKVPTVLVSSLKRLKGAN